MRGGHLSSSHLVPPVPRLCWEDRCWRWSVLPKDCKWKNPPFLYSAENLKCPPAQVSSSLFVSFPSLRLCLALIPDPPLKSPGPKWAAICQPSARPSCTTRGPFVLWTCPSQTREITAAPPGINSAQCTTPSTLWSKVCPCDETCSTSSGRSVSMWQRGHSFFLSLHALFIS